MPLASSQLSAPLRNRLFHFHYPEQSLGSSTIIRTMRRRLMSWLLLLCLAPLFCLIVVCSRSTCLALRATLYLPLHFIGNRGALSVWWGPFSLNMLSVTSQCEHPRCSSLCQRANRNSSCWILWKKSEIGSLAICKRFHNRGSLTNTLLLSN